MTLGMLAQHPQIGYTIKKWIEKEYSHFWQESYGQIVYSITSAGRRALSDWLRKEPEIEKLRYEIL